MKLLEINLTKIVDGLPGSEGPVFDTKGQFYAVAPMDEASENRKKDEFIDGIGGKLFKIDLESGQKEMVCMPHFDGYGGRPAGCQSDKNNTIWIADMRLGLLKWNEKGCVQMSKVDTDGNPLRGGNDLVFDDDGNLWFTGPGSDIAPAPEERDTIFKEPVGCIYCLPQGESIPIKVDGNFIFCNGIAVRNKLLLVAETVKHRIIAYDITGPGKVANRRTWAQVPPPVSQGGPDGMDFDIKGQLLVANHGSSHIEVYSQGGGAEPVARIKCPFATPSNVHFKPGTKTCYVTEHEFNGVWSFEWECEGMPMYCDK
ncbi:diisopropyl-fluorophosphatase-like [Clavelina lepadiformis]|uniref:SMP-30/Gluconolactonase/LRE-like region domain-containing protein n=1 Tax=Clavelina lepadiformis TaxID=159417 RepID=A0ABP0FAH2_CLALP